MPHRVAIYAIVWAYIANALWIPAGLDDGYWVSILFPAPYYLLIGGIVGGLYEAFRRRWSHWLVTTALTLLLVEWARWLFAGQLPFIDLALPFMVATLIASYLAKHIRHCFRYSRTNAQDLYAVGIAGFLLLIASLLPSSVLFLRSKPIVSPNGAYVARCFAGSDFFEDDDYHLYIGPGRMPFRWFGYRLPKSMYGPAENLHWASQQTLMGVSPDSYNSYQGSFGDVQIEIQKQP